MTIWISRELPFSFFSVSIYHELHTHTPESKVMAIWIFWEFPCTISRVSIIIAGIGDPSENLWPFKFLESFHGLFSSVLKYHAPHTYTQVKSYGCLNFLRASVYNFESLDILWAWIGHLNFLRASMVHFRASWNIMDLTDTPESKVMAIWISRELPWFIFERLNISWASHIHPSQKL